MIYLIMVTLWVFNIFAIENHSLFISQFIVVTMCLIYISLNKRRAYELLAE